MLLIETESTTILFLTSRLELKQIYFEHDLDFMDIIENSIEVKQLRFSVNPYTPEVARYAKSSDVHSLQTNQNEDTDFSGDPFHHNFRKI